jgi:DNA-directed RNA polymerase beta subunit
MNFAARHNSASRSVMMTSHLSQRLVINGATEKRIQTGMEKEMAKYTFSVKMPADGQIVRVIDRYPPGIHEGSLNFNPETIVIYENHETKEIDYFSIPHYQSYHQFFGFEYKKKETLNQLRPRANIAKGTIFADSPSVSDNGGFMYGIEANVAFMSVPSVSEDGFMVSESFLERTKFNIFETRVVEFGASHFPINLNGNAEEYKPFPDIGEYVREDGLLMVLREYDNDLSPVEMSVFDVREVDNTFDKATYVRGGKGKIVDIKVIKNNNPTKMLPDLMTVQMEKYHKALLRFHQSIIDTDTELRMERKKKYGESKLKISPKLHRLIVESYAMVNHAQTRMKNNLNLLYRKAPIDEYRIEFVIQYELKPGVGFKLTDSSGGKGVVVKRCKDEDMPIDAHGNRAEVVADSAAVISRMNLGRLYEHYLGGACRDVSLQAKYLLGFTKDQKVNPAMISKLSLSVRDAAIQHIMQFFKVTSPRQYEHYSLILAEMDQFEWLSNVCNDGIYLYFPIDNPISTSDAVREVERLFKPTYGPVTYRGESGEMVTTKDSVRIAPLYLMLLDKIADDGSAVSSCKLQHFGVPSQTIKSEKFSYPFRNSSVRTIGETEGRIFDGYCGEEAIAEMMDRSNNPATHRNMIWNILSADKPGNIDHVVDRNYLPLGSTRPLQLISHITKVTGFEHVYEPEDDKSKK